MINGWEATISAIFTAMIKAIFALLLFVVSNLVSAQEIPRWKATDMVSYLEKKDGATVKVVNIWATFCKPCIEEIPGFIRVIEKMGDDVELMLVSVDLKNQYPEKILSFAKDHKFTAQMAWLDETNADYFCPKLDKSWSGSIPATLIINTRTGYRKFIEDEMGEELFEREIKAAF